MDLKDRVAIITGASSGIGLAVAKRLAALGAKVALIARTEPKLAEAAAAIGPAAAIFPMDVTDRAAVLELPNKVKSRLGRVDIVINNAGVNHRGALKDRTPAEIAQILDANLIGPILLTRAALDVLPDDGVVVNVASLAGKIPVPHEATYSASKFGLRAFGIALGLEHRLHGHGPRITNVNPGPVDTGFFGDDLNQVPDLVFSQPMSTSEQVAEAILRVIHGPEDEIDVPSMSGKLATLGYLSSAMYTFLRPSLEKRGAKNKAKFIKEKRQ